MTFFLFLLLHSFFTLLHRFAPKMHRYDDQFSQHKITFETFLLSYQKHFNDVIRKMKNIFIYCFNVFIPSLPLYPSLSLPAIFSFPPPPPRDSVSLLSILCVFDVRYQSNEDVTLYFNSFFIHAPSYPYAVWREYTETHSVCSDNIILLWNGWIIGSNWNDWMNPSRISYVSCFNWLK